MQKLQAEYQAESDRFNNTDTAYQFLIYGLKCFTIQLHSLECKAASRYRQGFRSLIQLI